MRDMARMGTRPGFAFTLALMLAGCAQEQPPAPPPATFTVATPLQRDLVDWDEYVGRFEAIQDVQVMPRVSGQITRIGFREGVEVGRGAFLFEIDPRPFRAALAQAQAEVSRARATLANARTELTRAQTLLASNAISREEYEQRLAASRTGEAGLAAAQANARTRALDVEFTTVRAPVAGRVSDRRVAVGDFVTAGQTLLTRVVSVSPIWFTFDGAESFYLKYIRQAQAGERRSSRYAANPVEIQLADENGYRWRGRMVFVDNAIDTGSGTIRAHAEVANPDGFLVPGMFGRARLLGSGTYKAMLIPPSAVVTDQSRRVVWVIGRDGAAAQRVVELGPQVDGLAVVRAGLAPTDRVVIDNIGMLQPGMKAQTRPGRIRPVQQRVPDSAPLSTPPAAGASDSTGS